MYISFNLERLATIRFKLEKIFKFDFESAEDSQILERSENFTLLASPHPNWMKEMSKLLLKLIIVVLPN